MIINCIGIDDEPYALEVIQSFTARIPELKLVGLFSNLFDAKERISEGGIDLIFLDILFNNRQAIPESDKHITGIDFLRLFPNPPLTIVTTGEYRFDSQIAEYNLTVVDILHKLFSFERFQLAVGRVFLQYSRQQELFMHNEIPEFSDYTYFRINNQFVKVNHERIVMLESRGDFIDIHLIDEGPLRTQKLYLKEVIAKQLVPTQGKDAQFMKIHRSFVIALDKFKAINRGCSSVEIAGRTITISPKFRAEFCNRVGLNCDFS